MLATAPGSRLVIREKRGRRHLHRNIYPNSRSAFGGYIATGSLRRLNSVVPACHFIWQKLAQSGSFWLSPYPAPNPAQYPALYL